MKNTEKQTACEPKPFVLQRRIGSTTYRVNAYFNPATRETMNDKVLRLLQSELNRTSDTNGFANSKPAA